MLHNPRSNPPSPWERVGARAPHLRPVAAALAMAALMLTGCSSPQAAGSPTAAAPTGGGSGAAASAPSAPKVQRLVMSISPPNTESNKVGVAATVQFFQLFPMYEFLIGVSEKGEEMTPQLASAWKLEPDGKSYRFTLRPNVPFHGGKGNVTAADVAFSFDDNRKQSDEDVVPPQVKTMAKQVLGVDAVSPTEVVVRLDKPDAGFLTGISQAENVMPIRSKADADSRNRAPTMQDAPYAGTGPYAFSERDQSRYVRYKRVDGEHWRKTPAFPEFEYRFAKEASTRLASLIAREVQMTALTPDLTPQAAQAGFKVIQGTAPGLHAFFRMLGVYTNKRIQADEKLNADPNAPFIYMNTPLLDVRVRKALNKAIDRDALNKAFIGGKGETIYNLYFHQTRPGWNADWPSKFKDAYGYDPAAAKQLLADAGYGPAKPLTITMQLRPYPAFTGILDIDEAVGNYWQAIGVQVKLEQADSAEFSAKDRQAAYDDHVYGVATSVRQLLGVGIYNSANQGQRGGIQLPELEDVYEQIRVAVDPQKANQLWRQWGDMAFERYVNIPLFWIPSEAIVDPNIIGNYTYPGSITGTYTHLEYITPS